MPSSDLWSYPMYNEPYFLLHLSLISHDSYTDDNLTGIVHNGFAYAFNYDAFGNVSDVSVAGKQAVRYEYEDGNGNLLKVCYGNGAYIRYEYDKQNRIHMVYFKDAADSKEQNLYRYADI